jgi:hypothetical protein
MKKTKIINLLIGMGLFCSAVVGVSLALTSCSKATNTITITSQDDIAKFMKENSKEYDEELDISGDEDHTEVMLRYFIEGKRLNGYNFLLSVDYLKFLLRYATENNPLKLKFKDISDLGGTVELVEDFTYADSNVGKKVTYKSGCLEGVTFKENNTFVHSFKIITSVDGNIASYGSSETIEIKKMDVENVDEKNFAIYVGNDERNSRFDF